jgi:HD superfamily phosphohydrolase
MTTDKHAGGARDRAYYMENVKFIRDPVHDYVYLTKFDIELIDTPEFQRLKDIRQVTCQNVYPAARHTRFEHSLGVMELTRQALKALNQNGTLASPFQKGQVIFDEHLEFNAALAALLHDVGHCPFSHMGEVEFDKGATFERLRNLIEHLELEDSPLLNDFKNKKSGSVHEQMSCIVILEKFHKKLSNVVWEGTEGCHKAVDFELIIRSIIGLPYGMSTKTLYQKNKKKNVIVELINSKIFDMDKLDYIMRDALSTGIDAPGIDTHRLFSNMYITSNQDYSLVFLHRAVPALQNMVEARDALYMYVYNHHVTVFSDFMYSYIFRRLAHNAEAFLHLVLVSVPPEAVSAWEKAHVGAGANRLDTVLWNFMIDPIINLGTVPKSYLFSPAAILEQKRSDSDMISLLHDIYYELFRYGCFQEGTDEQTVEDGTSELADSLRGEIQFHLESLGLTTENIEIPEDEIKRMISKIRRVFTLIDKYQKREFLKPWWKTNFEYTNFIDKNFVGTPAHEKLGEWICHGEMDTPRGDEFRSQLAKHVIYVTGELYKQYGSRTGLLEPLEDGDFFVIERSPHFLDKDTISKLNIALKNNEILGKPGQAESLAEEYFVDKLTNIFPQRDYYEIYDKKGFYIFSKPLREGLGDDQQRERHYRLIEEIFSFVAKQLTRRGELTFQESFVTSAKAQIQENERESFESALAGFVKFKGFADDGKLQ